jgi:hypothetical protein
MSLFWGEGWPPFLVSGLKGLAPRYPTLNM